jgi:SAM-dependent methyltransferase
MKPSKPRDILRHFYDNFGWKRDPSGGRTLGERAHEDLSKPVQEYMESAEARFLDTFREGGNVFLDAACGAEPRMPFGSAFARHLCVDLSLVGLKEARHSLGDRGLYVLADLAALPFRDGTLDGVLASHCLYHVDKNQQPAVVQELARVTRPGKPILIFYSHKKNLMTALEKIAVMLQRLFSGKHRIPHQIPPGEEPAPPPIYFERLPLPSLLRGIPAADIHSLRIFSTLETRFLARIRLLRPALLLAAWLESRFPRLMVYAGPYVAIRIRR